MGCLKMPLNLLYLFWIKSYRHCRFSIFILFCPSISIEILLHLGGEGERATHAKSFGHALLNFKLLYRYPTN